MSTNRLGRGLGALFQEHDIGVLNRLSKSKKGSDSPIRGEEFKT